MATDGLSLFACIREMQPLVGGKIEKVQQPNKDILILHIHTLTHGRVKLMLCIHAENGRMQLISRNFENPEKAPAFCMLLRKHLIGCRIASIEQAGLNRIAVISLNGKDAFLDAMQLQLVVELMGRHGNLFLLDADGRIMDCMRHFGISEQAARICLPNVPYEKPPEAEKLSPFSATKEQLDSYARGRMPRYWLSDAVHGISRLCAEQIVSDDTPEDEIVPSVLKVFSDLAAGRFLPCIVANAGILPFVPKNASYRSFPSMDEAQDAFYRSRDEQAIITRSRTALRSVLEHAKKRTEKRLTECMQTIGDASRIERDRLYGELLTGVKGSGGSRSSIVVQNYYENPPVPIEIPLDPKFSVSENAKRYFKRYQKNKSARTHALEQSEALREELDYLKGQLLNVAACTSEEEFVEIRDELIRMHYIRENNPERRRTQAKSRPMHYRTDRGTEIFVGKNNLQNEQLVRTSDPNATWLHAKGIPSSHVILNSEEPSREELALAAKICAFHSEASASENVPVDYTLVKYVKKPSGSRPGFVNYFHQHTLYVTPSSDEILPYRVREDL